MTLLKTFWCQRDKILLLLIYVAVFFLPFNITVTNITLVAASAISIITYVKEKKAGLTLAVLPIVFFPFFLISLLTSEDFEKAVSWLEIGSSFIYIPIIFCLSKAVFTPAITSKILTVFVVGILLYCLYHYLTIAWSHEQFLPNTAKENYTYHEPFSRYAFAGSYPVYLSVFILFSLIIVFEKLPGNKVVLMLSIALSAFFLIILSSKNQIIVYFPVLSFLLWRHIHSKAWVKLISVIIILTVIVFLGAKDGQIRYRFGKEISKAESDRFYLWDAAIQIASENLFAGVGIGDRSRILQEKLAVKNQDLALTYNNAHNQFLDFLIAFGLFGLIAFLIVLFAPFILRTNTIFILLILIIVAASMTESFLFRQKGVSFFLLFYGLLGCPYNIFAGKGQRM